MAVASSSKTVWQRHSRLLILAAALAAGAVALSLVLVSYFHEQLIAAMGTLVLLAVLAHTLRSEQQSRRMRRSLTALESAASANRAEVRALASTVNTSAALNRRIARDAADARRRVKEGFANRKDSGLFHDLVKTSDKAYQQVQAAINLFALVDVTAPVPPFRGWAVSPDALNILVQEMITGRPSTVVECGSGSSTLFLALVAKKFGIDTRIVALDHDVAYAAKTNELLAVHGVDHLASARLAPLTEVVTDHASQDWYDPSALDGLRDVGLLFVDGPPAATGPLARHPALPLLWHALSPNAVIVLDDTNRQDEQDVIALWRESHPELVAEEFGTEKGTCILRRA